MYPDLKMLHPCDDVTLWRVLPIFVMTRVTSRVLRPRDVSCHDTINPADTTKTIMHTAQMSTAIECVEVHKQQAQTWAGMSQLDISIDRRYYLRSSHYVADARKEHFLLNTTLTSVIIWGRSQSFSSFQLIHMLEHLVADCKCAIVRKKWLYSGN